MKTLKFLNLFFLIFVFNFFLFPNNCSSNIKNNNKWIVKSPYIWPIMIRPGIRSNEHRTLYYFDQFIPIMGINEFLFFFNPKFEWDNKKTNEQNYGLGFRKLTKNTKHIYGFNLYLDKKNYYKNYFWQIGCGGEYLNKWVDLRLNGYLPITDKKVKTDIYYSFGQNNLIKHIKSKYIKSQKGLDYEIGFLFPYLYKYFEIKLFLGGYNFFSKTMNGFRGRLEIRPTPLILLNLEITYDSKFHKQHYVGGNISIPFSLDNLFKRKNPFRKGKEIICFGKGVRSLKERMTDQVIRDLDIVIDEKINVYENKVHDLVYVDNSYIGGSSDGSFDKPYTTVQDGVNNVFGDKWVYIREGNQTYYENVVLTEGITLWGSGYNGGFNGIPTYAYPIIDANFVDQPIQVVSYCSIMGIKAINALGGNIIGNDINNVNIHHNICVNNISEFGGGIAFTSFNQDIFNINIYNNNLILNSASGILIKNQGSFAAKNINIYSNYCEKNGDGISILNANNGYIDNIIINNNISNFNDDVGIYLSTTIGNISRIFIINNTCTNNIGHGIYMINFSNESIHSCVVSHNTCKGHFGSGITFWNGKDDFSSNGSFTNHKVFENYCSLNSFGIQFRNKSSGNSDAIYEKNISRDNTNGFYFLNAHTGTLNVDLYNNSNSIYNNTDYDLYNDIPGVVINAQNNWWGTSNGPNPSKLGGNINYTPWLTKPPLIILY